MDIVRANYKNILLARRHFFRQDIFGIIKVSIPYKRVILYQFFFV